jgi:hypothetical protein
MQDDLLRATHAIMELAAVMRAHEVDRGMGERNRETTAEGAANVRSRERPPAWQPFLCHSIAITEF